MDSYFTKKFTDNLTLFLKKRGVTEDLKHRLHDAGIDTDFFLNLLIDEDFSTSKTTRPFRKINSKIRHSLGRCTSRSTQKIDELFSAYELTELSKNAINKSRTSGLLKGVRKPDKRLVRVI